MHERLGAHAENVVHEVQAYAAQHTSSHFSFHILACTVSVAARWGHAEFWSRAGQMHSREKEQWEGSKSNLSMLLSCSLYTVKDLSSGNELVQSFSRMPGEHVCWGWPSICRGQCYTVDLLPVTTRARRHGHILGSKHAKRATACQHPTHRWHAWISCWVTDHTAGRGYGEDRRGTCKRYGGDGDAALVRLRIALATCSL